MRCNLYVAKLGYQVVDADDSRQEKRLVAQRKHLLLKKQAGASVVENDKDAVEVLPVFVPDTVGHRVKKRFH